LDNNLNIKVDKNVAPLVNKQEKEGVSEPEDEAIPN